MTSSAETLQVAKSSCIFIIASIDAKAIFTSAHLTIPKEAS